MATALPFQRDPARGRARDSDVDVAIREHCATEASDDPAVLLGSPFFREVVRSTLESPASDGDRRRGALISRLAVVLGDMAERGIGPDELGEDPIAWRDRADLEQLLDAWEAGQHPVQLRAVHPAPRHG